MNTRFPLYIVSKSRAHSRLTVKALLRMHLDFYVVIEAEQYKEYAAVIEPKYLLVLDKKFQDEYNTLDNLGSVKSKGPGPARNFAWQHSIDQGYTWHWVMDDNIHKFYRFNCNRQIEDISGKIFYAMEEFCLRYSNVVMAGPQYFMFVPRKKKLPPFTLNNRIYSCNFIRNDIPWRWRGRYNEDTDLSLMILKSGLCTIQFNAFLQQKAPTQTIGGGCTKDFYQPEGTFNKSKMLAQVHSDVAKVVYRFGRIHHYVDYSQFKKNKLLRNPSAIISDSSCQFESKLSLR